MYGEGNEPFLLLDKRTGEPIPELSLLDDDGTPLDPANIVAKPGPGADRETSQRFEPDSQT